MPDGQATTPEPQLATPVDNTVYLKPAVVTVDEVITRQEELTQYIEAHEPRRSRDGVACFNYLYTVITKRVRDGINAGRFTDKNFLTQLDVAFANRYLDALRLAVVDPSRVPRCWNVLLERRSDERVEPIQFAVAGVNAHINFDLALAVVEACHALHTEPDSGTQRSDYEKVNDIFAVEMQALRQHYQDELQRTIDTAASPVLNMVGHWSVDAARDAAWEIAEHLWTLERFGIDSSAYSRRIDRLASLSGNLLLTPIT